MRLLEPIDIGARQAPNRVLFGPHETNLGRGRALSDRHLAYYARRLEGGAGIIVTEEASVHPSDWPYERCPLAADCGPGWRDLVQRRGSAPTLLVAALGHTGGQGSSAFSQRELWAPSGVPEVNTRETPKVMEPEDIEAVVTGFVASARCAIGAGLDGIEINAGQNSLIRQFLSGLTNVRSDGYGQDRLRLAHEVLGAVRTEADDAIVGLRLSCDELAPWAGLVPEAAAEIAAELARHVDYLVVVRGAIYSVPATRPDGHDEPGFNLGLVGQIRDAVDPRVAVFAQGSIIDVGQANWAIEDGRCDGVEMTRAQIADPDLVRKAQEDPSRIRPCVLCNQLCKVRDNRNPIVSCIGEPRSGYETEEPDDRGNSRSRRQVLVVGAGPAGLEAARVAAMRGHDVRLVDRGSAGGMVRAAAAGAGRARLADLTDWLRAECERLGVAVERAEMGQEDLATTDRELAVVLATGSQAAPPSFEIGAGSSVFTAAEILDAMADATAEAPADGVDGFPFSPPGPVLVWDPIGGPIGVSLAESLAATGYDVGIAVTDNIAGNLLSLTGDLAPANVRLQAAGVRIHRRSRLRSTSPGVALVEDIYTGTRTRVPADHVIDAGHRIPDTDPWPDAPPDRLVVRVGDLVAPRTIAEAIREGRRAVFTIEHWSNS